MDAQKKLSAKNAVVRSRPASTGLSLVNLQPSTVRTRPSSAPPLQVKQSSQLLQSSGDESSAEPNGRRIIHTTTYSSLNSTVQNRDGTCSQKNRLKKKYEKDVRSQFNDVLKRSKAVGGKIEQ